jgi:tRNA(fMet)-specific endonuclease VapC
LEEKFEYVLEESHLIIIPPVSYYEILRGLYANNSSGKLGLFEMMCNRLGVQDMNRADWIQAAHLYAESKKNGTPMEDPDLMQASFCLQHRYVLVTNNVKHFDHIHDLSIDNWTVSDHISTTSRQATRYVVFVRY